MRSENLFSSSCFGPFRLFGWTLITFLLLIALWLLRAEQMPVILYKLCLVTTGAVLGYWIDRAIFPYARPHTHFPPELVPSGDGKTICSRQSILPALFMFRRAVIVFACVLGLTLGL